MEFRRINVGLQFVLGLLLVMFMTIGFVKQTRSDDTNTGDGFDLNVLIDRVSNSKALGFLTKLSLKRDIDRFLDNVGRYHKGAGDLSLE